jgi:hypothetical protein
MTSFFTHPSLLNDAIDRTILHDGGETAEFEDIARRYPDLFIDKRFKEARDTRDPVPCQEDGLASPCKVISETAAEEPEPAGNQNHLEPLLSGCFNHFL